MKLDLWSKLEEYRDRTLDTSFALSSRSLLETNKTALLRKSVKPPNGVSRSWLWQYREEDLIVDRNLPELTKVKFEQTSSLINRSNIIIAESDPIDLLAAFLAGVIRGANVFLCDPDWQKQEWQQVLSLVEPDFVFADREIKDLLLEVKGNNNNKIVSPS